MWTGVHLASNQSMVHIDGELDVPNHKRNNARLGPSYRFSMVAPIYHTFLKEGGFLPEFLTSPVVISDDIKRMYVTNRTGFLWGEAKCSQGRQLNHYHLPFGRVRPKGDQPTASPKRLRQRRGPKWNIIL